MRSGLVDHAKCWCHGLRACTMHYRLCGVLMGAQAMHVSGLHACGLGVAWFLLDLVLDFLIRFRSSRLNQSVFP